MPPRMLRAATKQRRKNDKTGGSCLPQQDLTALTAFGFAFLENPEQNPETWTEETVQNEISKVSVKQSTGIRETEY